MDSKILHGTLCQWHRPIVSTFASFQSTGRAPSVSDFRYTIDSGHAVMCAQFYNTDGCISSGHCALSSFNCSNFSSTISSFILTSKQLRWLPCGLYLLVLPGSRARIVRRGRRYDPAAGQAQQWVSEWVLVTAILVSILLHKNTTKEFAEDLCSFPVRRCELSISVNDLVYFLFHCLHSFHISVKFLRIAFKWLQNFLPVRSTISLNPSVCLISQFFVLSVTDFCFLISLVLPGFITLTCIPFRGLRYSHAFDAFFFLDVSLAGMLALADFCAMSLNLFRAPSVDSS